MKKNAFLVLIACFVLFTTAFAPLAKGHKYSSEEGKMSIVFPNEFEIEESDLENVKVVKITATHDELFLFASYSLHKTEITNHESLAELSVQSFAESITGTINGQSEWKVKKHNGLKAMMELAENESRVQYNVILVGDIQYQLVVVAPQDSWDQEAADTFFKSFKLKK